jgi:hypothetical protein
LALYQITIKGDFKTTSSFYTIFIYNLNKITLRILSMIKLLKNTMVLALFITMPLHADIYHVVICWLKNPNNHADKAKLITTTQKLQNIKGVESIQVGNMVPSKRKIVNSSYDIGIIFQFKTKKAMKNYLNDPLHKKALQEVVVPLTSNVIVYDFETI